MPLNDVVPAGYNRQNAGESSGVKVGDGNALEERVIPGRTIRFHDEQAVPGVSRRDDTDRE
jgi:hypothetical protein